MRAYRVNILFIKSSKSISLGRWPGPSPPSANVARAQIFWERASKRERKVEPPPQPCTTAVQNKKGPICHTHQQSRQAKQTALGIKTCSGHKLPRQPAQMKRFINAHTHTLTPLTVAHHRRPSEHAVNYASVWITIHKHAREHRTE